ncbi:MAG: PPC domain-containing protein [Planctomycetaceae bacterium]|nr:PPC domain-containing protein [Planctomycetaceae bacterium]
MPSTSTYPQSPKVPDAGYVFPPAVVIGQTNVVTSGGYDWTDDLEWFIDSPQVSFTEVGLPGEYILTPPPYWIGQRASTNALPIPREVSAQIDVSPDATPGIVCWQTANANGVGKMARFVVTTSPDVVEQRLPNLPQMIPAPPIAVSGRLSRLTEVDRYEFTAADDQLITVDLMARRLGSDFNGVIEVHNEQGEMVTDVSDTLGQDSTVSFAAHAGKKYSVSIRDVDFRGDRSYIYRLILSHGPRIESIFPAFAQRGCIQNMTFRGLCTQRGMATPFTVTADIPVPADPQTTMFVHALETPDGRIDVEIPLSDVTELVRENLTHQQPSPITSEEATPDDTNRNGSAQAASAPPLLPSSAVTAMWNPTSAVHRYQWDAGENTWWNLQLQSRAIGSALDVALAVLDSSGKDLASVDDVGPLTDATLSFHASSAGLYFVEVRAVDPPTGHSTEQYRLLLQPELPGFELTAPQAINLPLGGKTSVEFQLHRRGGLTDAVTITAAELPQGVTLEGDATIPEGKDKGKFTLVAAADAKIRTSRVQFQGTALIDGTAQTVVAQVPAAGNLAPRTLSDITTSTSLLAITMPPPFRILVVDRERQRDVPRGTTCLADLVIERDDGFEGELLIAMSAKQSRDRQGIRGPLLKVPDGATQVQYPCFMPEWLSTDLTRRIVVHGVGAVRDPEGNVRWLTNAGDARITMIMEGALLKVTLPQAELQAETGATVQIPVTVLRSSRLPRSVQLELVIPEELREMLHCRSVTLPADADAGVLQLQVDDNPLLPGQWDLIVRGTAADEHDQPVVSQQAIDLRITPKQSAATVGQVDGGAR